MTDEPSAQMKHVWILNHYAQEPGGPGGTRHFSLARHLPPHGWTASIIAAGLEHGTGRERLGPGELSRLDHYDGIPFLWLKTNSYTANDGARVRNMLNYTRRALRRDLLSVLPKPDAVIGSSVHPFAALAGWRLARRHKVPFIFEVRDLWPQTLIDMGRLSAGSPAARAMGVLERFLYRRARRIITLLPRAADYIVPIGIPAQRIVWISNGADLDAFPATPYPVHREGLFDLMYFGAHGDANGLENLLQAMEIVAKRQGGERIGLRLIGDGPKKAELKAMAANMGLATVRFEDPVPKSSIPKIAAQAEALLFNLIDAPVFRYGISSNKLFDYLAAARPIIIASSAANNPVADAGAGMTVPPEQPARLAEAILAMVSLPHEERARMGLAGRQHVEAHYDYDRLSHRLAMTLDACGKEEP